MRKVWICFCIICLCFLVSCSNGEEEILEDTYIEGQDHQYMFVHPDLESAATAKGDKGYYACSHHFLIYFDAETKTAAPLCNRVDCLHDREKNKELRKQCHAYVDFASDDDTSQVQYYNGALYMKNPLNDENQEELIRFPIDGSERTVVRTFDEAAISYWFIHRGYMYFVSSVYNITDEEGGTVDYRHSLLRCSVNDTKEAVELVYEPNQELSGRQVLTPQAYGNHIYFFERGFTKPITSGVDYKEYLSWKTFQYDIRTKEIGEIMVEEQKNNPYAYVACGAGCLTFVDDKILFAAHDVRDKEVKLNYGIGTQWYLADLDGSNQKKVLTTEYKYSKVYCDGKYIYVDNQWELEDFSLQAEEKGEEYKIEQKYLIYDKDFNLVDTMRFPFDHIVSLDIGDENYQILHLGDETSGALEYIDKSQIGSFKGGYPDTERVYDIKVPY